METIPFRLPPFSIELDDCIVDILEVTKTTLISGEAWYHVAVRINYRGLKSRRFTVDVRSERELKDKLRVEIAKVKFIYYAYGIEEVRRLIT